MPRVVVSDDFIDSAAALYSDRVFNEVFHFLDLLETTPEIGSTNLPERILRRFGDNCRKIVVDPFDILYRYDPETDTVYVAELIHQRRVY